MFSWKVLWSIVFVTTVSPGLAFWNAATSEATAAFGTASDWFDPSLTVPLAAPPPLAEPPLLPTHAESRLGRANAAPATPAPRSRARRSSCWARMAC